MKRSFIYSLILHSMLLLALLLSSDEKSKDNPQGNSDKEQQGGEKIIPKGEKEESIAEVTLIEMPGKKEKLKGDDCEDGHWYGGIGIYEGYNNGSIVESVIPGYPADKAGLKTGDLFISNVYDIKGTPRTRVDVVISRQGITLYFTMIREKICTE